LLIKNDTWVERLEKRQRQREPTGEIKGRIDCALTITPAAAAVRIHPSLILASGREALSERIFCRRKNGCGSTWTDTLRRRCSIAFHLSLFGARPWAAQLFYFLSPPLSSPKIEFASWHKESEAPPRCLRLSVPSWHKLTRLEKKEREKDNTRNMSFTFREVKNDSPVFVC
jgi:hypothetical protein